MKSRKSITTRSVRKPSRASDARVRELIEVSSNWYYWEQDKNRRYTRVSGSILEKGGIDPGFFVGKSLAELGGVPVGDDSRWEKHWTVLDSHQPFTELLFTFPAPRGELRYISASGQPMFDASGKFVGYRGISRDVTTRIQVERRRSFEHEASRILADVTSIPEATTAIIRSLCQTLGWACGSRWELDRDSQMLRPRETWGLAAAGVEDFLAATRRLTALPLSGDGLVRRACASGEPQWIPNVGIEPTFMRAPDALKASLQSAFAFPIVAGSKILGAMEFFSAGRAREVDVDLINSAVNVGRGIGQFYERKQAEEELLRFRSMMDLSPDLIFIVDPEAMRFIYANEANSRLSGFTREDYRTMSPAQVSGQDPADLKRLYDDIIAKGGEPVIKEALFRAKSGPPGWFETHRRAVRMGDKWVILTVSREITARKLAERAAARQSRMYAALSATNEAIMRATSVEQLYQQVCDAAVDGGKFFTTAVVVPDADSGRTKIAAVAGEGAPRLRAVSMSLDDVGAESQGLIGTAFRTLSPSVSNDFLKDERLRPWHAAAKESGINAGAAVPLIRNGSAIGTLLFHSLEKRAFDEDVVKLLERVAKNLAFALGNLEHEAERKRGQERIQYLATHDGLTGLPNRTMFSEMLNLAIESARRYERKFAVLFLDLDRFKVVNDSLGHEAGDVLLREISARLKEILRASDVVARFGGDEFVLLAQEVSGLDQVSAVARKILSTVLKPMNILGQECRVTASIGISMYPGDATDEQSLMRNADIAMYLAKEEGKNNFQFYSAEMKSQSLERMTLETNLRRAMERDEFTLHYQAKVDLKTGAINGVEALLRWTNPDLGSVSPAQFIPLAEETGLIVPIGKWVLRTACEQNVAWQRAGLPPVCMAVNLSARQFSDENLLVDIADALGDSGMEPKLLELEITEGMVIHNPERAIVLLKAIKKMGVRLAIDDFGTGYSSLGQLKNFPIDTLKVDRSFIREIPRDSEDRAITEAIIAMGKTLSLTVVAEGVETKEQETFLREHACDEMQGFYFSKPVAPELFADLLRNHVPIPKS